MLAVLTDENLSLTGEPAKPDKRRREYATHLTGHRSRPKKAAYPFLLVMKPLFTPKRNLCIAEIK